MRRLTTITAFALFLAVPLWAQRGSGHAGGGHGGLSSHGRGFSGRAGFGGGRSGGQLRGGRRSGSSRGFAHSSHRTFSNAPFLHSGFHRGFRNHRFRNDCWRFGCRGRSAYRYPWGVGYYDPWLWNWGDSDSSFDEAYERDRGLANEMNQRSLEEQQMLRQEEAEGDRDAYDRGSSLSSAESSDNSAPAPLTSPTLLVFRDQHQKEVRNYAIVGSTLWNFAPQHTERISLADLDVAATTKINDDRGVVFRVPAPGEPR
jgi:hypothetical protein